MAGAAMSPAFLQSYWTAGAHPNPAWLDLCTQRGLCWHYSWGFGGQALSGLGFL